MAQDMEVGTVERSVRNTQQPGRDSQSRGDDAQVTRGQRQNVSAGEETRAMLPRVDVLEDGQGITLLADLPGVPRENLELKVDGETLLIEGTVSTPTPQQMEAVYVEVRVPRFRRAFTLSRELDTEKIEANLTNGVLRLRIPKQAHAQPRKIAVQAA